LHTTELDTIALKTCSKSISSVVPCIELETIRTCSLTPKKNTNVFLLSNPLERNDVDATLKNSSSWRTPKNKGKQKLWRP